MKSKLTSTSSKNLFFSTAIAATVCMIWQATAANVTWDITPGTVGAGNSTVTGGAGTWNTTNGNWTTDAGVNNVAWNNANNDVAIFGDVAGAVALGEPITAGGLTFNATGYSVTGNILTLGGATTNITVGTGLTASISSEITGTILNVGTTSTGTGTLTLSGVNTHTGLTNVNFGTVDIQNASAFGGTAAGTVVANLAALNISGGITVAGEPLTIRGAGPSPANAGALRNISGNNGWTGPITLSNSLRVTSDGGTLTLGDINTGSGRTFIMNGSGNVIVNGVISSTGAVLVDNLNNVLTPGTLTLNGVDTYDGGTTVTGGGTLTMAGARTLGTTAGIAVTQGIINMTGARTASSGTITVGNGNGQTGTLNLSNGDFSTSSITVGTTVLNAATGTPGIGIVNHTAGILSTAGQVLMGNFNTSSTIGSGTGTYNLSGGTLKSTSTSLAAFCLGTQTGGTATFNLSGTGSLEMSGIGGLLQIGRSSSTTTLSNGTFNQTGGTATLLNVAMGNTSNSNTTSVLSLTGGTFTVATAFTAMAAGATSTATITIGGTADVTLPAFPIARGSGSTATITFDGGTLRPVAASLAYITGMNSATIQDGGAKFVVATGKDITIPQALLTHPSSLGGGLTKAGVGILALSGINTYTGPTAVNEGTLGLDASGVINSASAVTVASGASLTGTGTAAGTLASSGTIAPGTLGVGTLTTGAATLSAGALAIEVSGATADKLVSTGAINLTGATLTVAELTAGSASSYVIAQGTSLTGTFATPSLPAGYSVTYTSTQAVLNRNTGSYSTWANTNGIPGQPASDDFDKDGLSNLVEYALNLNPTVSSVPPGTFSGGLLSFTKGTEALANGDVTYEIEQSTTLTGWTVVVANNPLQGSISYTLPTGQPKEFARLKITQIP